MRIVTTYARSRTELAGKVSELDIVPICPDGSPVIGYDEEVSIRHDYIPSRKHLMLYYNAHAILFDEENGEFVDRPVRIVARRRWGNDLIYEFIELGKGGICLAYVENCLSIEINGRRRYRVDGSGSIRLIVEEDSDVDPPQAEKEYSSVSRAAHTGIEPVVDGKIPKETSRKFDIYHVERTLNAPNDDRERSDGYEGPEI